MDQKNLFLAIALSLAILLGFQYFFEPPKPPEPATPAESAAAPASGVPATGGGAQVPAAPDRATVLAASPRVRIETPQVNGSISLDGGRIDDITLVTYHETVDPASPPITLLHPPGTTDAYYSDVGWVAETPGVAVPGPDTRWTADRDVLRTDAPVTLSWDNGQGLKFQRVIAIDRDYMITIRQKVENQGGAAVKLLPYELVARAGTPPLLGYYILHEGVVGVLGDKLAEHKYKDLQGAEKPLTEPSTGGWLGFTDKYWLVAVIPDQKEAVTTHVTHTLRDKLDHYQVDYLGQAREIAPGAAATEESRLFAGAKIVKLLRSYRDDLGIVRFDYAVDWGWFFFLTRPIFWLLDLLAGAIGNFGVSILLLTVCIRALFFPVANYSFRMMAKMKKLSPLMAELKEKYGDDKQKMNAELMQIYKREKVNPLSGCLPIALQIPVFFSLYKVLFVTIEMRHAPFFGWIKDLSDPDPTTIANLFGLIPWTPPEALMLGAWPIVMGITMFLQQKLNPQPPDPVQAKLFMIMPVVFTFMLAHFPAGLVIYWAWNNTLSMAQQYVLMRRVGQVPARKSPA